MGALPPERTEEREGTEVAPSEERRRHKRAELTLPIYVHSLEPEQRQVEDVRNVLNFSASGLYFTTWLGDYSVGMRLLVILPFSSVAEVHREYRGTVVRVEHLTNGSLGVAVEFLS